ncbi:MAG TPA: acyl-CoA dehydrogenase family protein [Pseudomonadales bacterium]|nr:acyl-CoA dehydrogenase family protein [Pseudomonadales bacterium]
MSDLAAFREEARAWLAENCPPGARGPGQIPTGSTKIPIEDPDVKRWLDVMAEKGWTVPMWPKEYGGAGLSKDEYLVLIDEMRTISARSPLAGMGTGLIGPTLLDYGNDDQKSRHLPRIARGEVAWCQGYSEPGAGSDLASLSTRAVLDGDNFIINGQKIWTSGAQFADWMFILVRTDPDAPKHEGISFLLLDMDQPGVQVKPIRLISGNSPFCESFFTDARAERRDLIGELNRGWTVGKRLLQHERSGITTLAGSSRRPEGPKLEKIADQYIGKLDGRIADADYRDRIIAHQMTARSLQLTQKRTVEETAEAKTPGPQTSMFKYYGSITMQNAQNLARDLRGFNGVGWEGEGFTSEELSGMRDYLSGRASSIYSGSNEIQLNIIAKRVLGLPD